MAQKVWNDGAPEGFIVFNYARSPQPAKVPAAEEIETLVPNAIMSELMKGDADPCFSVEGIPFPATGNGLRYGSRGIYKREFFNSFIGKTKQKAIPGSKLGHEWGGKCSDDFFVVGGKIVPNADDPKTGTAYLKMYIPTMGYTTPNEGLRRNARIHNIRYSIVAKPEYTIKAGADGVEEYVITGSIDAERNDAVEEGAMNQIVNSAIPSLDVDAAKALIANGDFDKIKDVDGDNPIQNGRVYRSVLRRLASRASGSDRSALGELLSMIDKTKNGRKSMEKEELLQTLGNLVKNGQTNLSEIAKATGLESQVRNADDAKNAELAKAVNERLGDKPLEKLDAIIAENADVAETIVKNTIAAAIGSGETIKNGEGKDIENPAFKYARTMCAGKKGDELKNALEELKKDPAMTALNAQRADGNSNLNKSIAGGAASAKTGGIAPLNV